MGTAIEEEEKMQGEWCERGDWPARKDEAVMAYDV